MAESENSQKPPNQAEFETQAQPKIEPEEEAADEENLVLPPEKSVHSLSPIVVPNFTTETSQSQTLTFSSLISPSDHDPDCHSFSELLAGAMASPTKMSPGSVSKPTVSMIDLPPALDPAGFKGQFGMSHQEALATVTAQAQAQAQRQLQAGSLHILPTSLEQSMVFAMSPTHKREFSPVSQDHTASTPPVNQKASFDPKTGHVNVVKETPCSDGYSWRKYGQKQVKSNERSRSYYKCTDSSCNAKKKVESSDHSGHVVEIVYKGQHNHEPPRKIRSTKASGCVSSAGAIVCVNSGRGNGVVEHPVKELTIPAPSRPEGESCYATCKEIVPVSNDSGRDAGVRHAEEQGDEPQPKRRMKNNRVASSTPQIKTIKDPKVVVQAAGDIGTSVDGYRWRKYGQKMVKGNPSPRSYYRCTSAGCPVRKHVDKAIDEAASIIITYEGKHDHDMPVPKKRNGPPNTPLLIAETCAVNGGKLKSSETSLDQKPSIPLAVEKGDPTGKKTTEVGGEKEKVDPTGEKAVELGGEKEKGDPAGEKAVELGGEKEKGDPAGEKGTEVGGEKVLESARTLLSIGIELKPY